MRFVTPIYHPNIDSGGRICLDTLKMRPAVRVAERLWEKGALVKEDPISSIVHQD